MTSIKQATSSQQKTAKPPKKQSKPKPPSGTDLIVTGEGPWFCRIKAARDQRFYELLDTIKAVPGRQYDGNTKQWHIPGSSEQSLIKAILKAQEQGFQTFGGPDLVEQEPEWVTHARLAQDHLCVTAGQKRRHIVRVLKSLGAEQQKDPAEWLISLPDTMRGWERLVERLRSVGVNAAIPEGVLSDQTAHTQNVEQQMSKLDNLPLRLRDYQRAGVRFVLEQKRALLADETGLGKTIQALAAVSVNEAYPAVVLCPASLRTNWCREAARMLPDKKVVSLEKPPKEEGPVDAEILIVGYESLNNRQKYLPYSTQAVICDEVHFMQSRKAARTQAAIKLITEHTTPDAMVLGLSATPVRNRPRELVPFLEASEMLPRIGSKSFFYNRYCNPQKIWTRYKEVTTYDGASHLDELHQKMSDTIMVRRRKIDVLHDLPAKLSAVVAIDLPVSLQKVYRHLASGFAEQLIEENVGVLSNLTKYGGRDPLKTASASSVLDHLMLDGIDKHAEKQLRQYGHADKSKNLSDMRTITELRKLLGALKRPAAIARVQEFLEEADQNEKMVVFAHHRSMVQGLARELGAGVIIGGQSDKERTAQIDRFTNNPKPRVLVCSIGAAAVGLNLQRANHILFAEQPWTPAECEQAEGRCYRIGQSRGVMVDYLVAANTLDEYIARVVEAKRKVTGDVLDGAGNWDQELSEHIQQWLAKQNHRRKLKDAPPISPQLMKLSLNDNGQ